MKMFIPFSSVNFDQPSMRQVGEIQAQDVIPGVGGYTPRLAVTETGTALNGRALGSIVARATSGTRYSYVGTASKLYERDYVSNYSDQSKGGGYATSAGESWEFANFDRNNKVIATNYSNPVQSMTIGAGASADFADMITSTNKPQARHIGIIGNHVVLGNTYDTTDGTRPNRVWWSAFGDETDFDPDSATLCDYEDLATMGPVQKIVSGSEYGLIFQTEGVRAMRFVGGAQIFEFVPIPFVPGTEVPNSVIAHEGRVYYIAKGPGFMMLNGTSPEPIGFGHVDSDLRTRYTYAEDAGTLYAISTAVDPARKLIYWTMNSGTATPDIAYVYNYGENKWATWSISNIDIFIEHNNASRNRVAVISTNFKLATLLGASMMGVITTGDYQPVSGARWQINSVRPRFDSGAFTASAPDIRASVAARDHMGKTITFANGTAINTNGDCPVRSSGNVQRVRMSMSVSFVANGELIGVPPKLTGLEVEYEIEGER